MPKETKIPRIVDCPNIRRKCDGKVDLEADETTCPKCGMDVGDVARRYEHQEALKEWERREREKEKPTKPEKKGFSW